VRAHLSSFKERVSNVANLRNVLATLLTFGASISCTMALSEPVEAPPSKLTVCADPSNLPYSNRALEGFENAIARVIAADLKMELDYFWFPEHQGFLRRSLLDGHCDVVMSVPSSLSIVSTTRPYFVSSYVTVTRARDDRRFGSFDDAWLKNARIGVQMVGKEGATTPPATALARRGLEDRLELFTMWSEDEGSNPQGDIVKSVAIGAIDVAFVWGPFGGYFAKSYGQELRVEPVTGDPQSPDQPFTYSMSIGVRKSDANLHDQLEGALTRHEEEIRQILISHGVPIVSEPSSTAAIEQASSPASNGSGR
jgi:mxaJ protein